MEDIKLGRNRIFSPIRMINEPVLWITIALIIGAIGLFVVYPLYKVMCYPALTD